MSDHFGDIHLRTSRKVSKEDHLEFIRNQLLKSDFFIGFLNVDFFIKDDHHMTTIVIELKKNHKLFFDTGVEDDFYIYFSSCSSSSNRFLSFDDHLNKLTKWFSQNYPNELITVTTWDSPYHTAEIVEVAQKQLTAQYEEFDISSIFSAGKEIFSNSK